MRKINGLQQNSKIPYETEQGIFFAEQGIFWSEQGISGKGREHHEHPARE